MWSRVYSCVYVPRLALPVSVAIGWLAIRINRNRQSKTAWALLPSAPTCLATRWCSCTWFVGISTCGICCPFSKDKVIAINWHHNASPSHQTRFLGHLHPYFLFQPVPLRSVCISCIAISKANHPTQAWASLPFISRTRFCRVFLPHPGKTLPHGGKLQTDTCCASDARRIWTCCRTCTLEGKT